MERILVINVNWIGDVIFSSPIFKALKEAHPQARITCMAVPRVKEILECVPHIDEVLIYDDKGIHWTPLGKLNLIFALRRRHFDAAFILHRSLTRALLVYLAGIPRRVGYDEKNRGRFLTHKVGYLEDQVHRSDYYLNVIESSGVRVSDRQCRLNATEEAQDDIKKILKSKNIQDHDYLVVINPGGNWDLKRWPVENYHNLIRQLQGLNVKIVISGAQKDTALIKKMNIASFNNVVDLTGQTSLKQLVALMKRANVVVSADSGPLHLASGVGCEVVGLFGPTRPEVTGPRGNGRVHMLQRDVGCNRKPCYHLQCPDNTCMKSIRVDDVQEIIKQIRNP